MRPASPSPRHRVPAGRGSGRRLAPVPLVAAASLLFGGCRHTLEIGTLLDHPHRYAGHTVQVEGTVVRSAGALGYGAYQVDDGTGSLLVVSDERGAPRAGARVRVVGWFRPLVTWGTLGLAGLLERGRGPP